QLYRVVSSRARICFELSPGTSSCRPSAPAGLTHINWLFYNCYSVFVMKNDSTASNRQTASASLVRWAVLTWMVGIAAFHIGSALAGRPIYRDIHLGTALEYAKGSINLLKPVVVGFNL